VPNVACVSGCPFLIDPSGFSNICGTYSTNLSIALTHNIQNNELIQEDLVFSRCKLLLDKPKTAYNIASIPGI
jgi:hypothetical protein